MNLQRANALRPVRPVAVAAVVALTLLVQVAGSWSPSPVAANVSPNDVLPSALGTPDTGSPDPTAAPTDDPAPDASATDPGATEPDPTDPSPTDPGTLPTLDPGASDAMPTPTDTPSDSATDAPAQTASDAPSDAPSDQPSPDAGPPVPSPDASASPEPSATPEPTPTPIPWDLSGGQQSGDPAAAPIPLFKLKAQGDPADPSVIHGISSLADADCAACHNAHTASSPFLLDAPAPGSTLCLRCHSGSGSSFDVADQLSGLPANDPSTDSYYVHVIETGSGPQVTCTDCHNPHDANDTRPVMTTTGWSASGDVRAANGVAVTNGLAGTAPTYTPISRTTSGGSLVLEYQLCLACHSGATTLPSPTAAHPSWWALDAGVEFNPANASYHPVEAAGKNLSTQMQASLAGTSPFKAWNFTIDSTIRCTSCHGDPSTVNQTPSGSPLTPDPATQEATHASPNRGLLIAPYRDRTLKAAGEPYNSADFALCYLCHAERPFVDPNENPSAPDTEFSLHGFHLTQISGSPDLGTSIDHAGDGPGLAICAECHFRIHSTALSYEPGDTSPVARSTGDTGLVDFAPDVQGIGSNPPIWNAPNSLGQGSCALTCHGFQHLASDTTYEVAPGTGFSASPTSGSVGTSGLAVQFTDATRYATPATASWSWSFGDGGTSTAQSPSHTYTSAGVYTVTLTVTRTAGPVGDASAVGLSSTMTRTSYITVTP